MTRMSWESVWIGSIPEESIARRVDILKWSLGYVDGDPNAIEDWQWRSIAEQTILDNPTMMIAAHEFPAPLEWEYAIYGDRLYKDREPMKDIMLSTWDWNLEAAKKMAEHWNENENTENAKVYCRLASAKVEFKDENNA